MELGNFSKINCISSGVENVLQLYASLALKTSKPIPTLVLVSKKGN